MLGNYTEKIERPVRALLQDDERTFWVGTKGNGILKIYDYEVDKNLSDCRAEVLTTSIVLWVAMLFIVLPEAIVICCG